MRNKWLIILNIFVLTVISLVLILAMWNFSFKKTVQPTTACVDLSRNMSFTYDACYDAYSKNILLEITRGHDKYNIDRMRISFFDFSEKSYESNDVPTYSNSKSYKIAADKNPGNIDISFNIANNLIFNPCKNSKKIFVDYCKLIKKNGMDVSISPSGKVGTSSFIDVGRITRPSQDNLNFNLANKKRVWLPKCESKWSCDNWEICSNGIQTRKCIDLKKCPIQINSPTTVRYCGKTCVENWRCDWSNCQNGFTVPKCNDLNRCGTSYNMPHKLKCGSNAKCTPNIKCTNWSNCEINYNFIDIVKNNIKSLAGTKSRDCIDKNSCIKPKEELENCSISVDIYTKKFKKCGENFIGIYDKLDDKLIARLNERRGLNPHLNIYLNTGRDGKYCDYCFDGIKDGDESGVDCGKSCESCADKYRSVSTITKSWFSKFTDLIKEIF